MNQKTDIKEKLVKLLKDIFQFENEDLDFGIYRVLSYKKKEIESFIQKGLIQEITTQLNLIGAEEAKKAAEELQALKQKLVDLGVSDYESNPKYQEKKKQLKNIKVSQDLEKEIYNHVYTFFARYYDKGDFISKRKYGKEKYAIPYNGEETTLYWANADQYYIKTTESFQKYSFKIPRLLVSFRVIQAQEEKANIKAEEKKFFLLSEEKKPEFEDKSLNIYFDFRALTEAEKEKWPRAAQDEINQDSIDKVKKAIGRDERAAALFKEDEKGKTLIEKQLTKYTEKNTSDYFIHKDLKAFLGRELDFYIKNEIVDLTDVTNLDLEQFNNYILEIKVIKNIAAKIIEFLAQIENFQKKIWEKKKFVLKTEYVITTDKIPEKFFDDIWGNDKQKKEWQDLGFEIPKSKTQLKGKTLPIDTTYFPQEFKEKLLEELTKNADLDVLLNGILIKSENFQALNLLSEKFKEKLNSIYIDPPFNTGSDAFLYKDKYQHSTWLCMMYDRLNEAKNLLNRKGNIYIQIDHNEEPRLKLLMDSIFGTGMFRASITWRKLTAAKAQSRFFSNVKDTIFHYTKSDESIFNPQFIEGMADDKNYPYTEEKTGRKYGSFDFTQKGSGPARRFGDRVLEPPPGKHWIWDQEKIDKGMKDGLIIFTKSGLPRVKRYLDEKEGNYLGDLWIDDEVAPISANSSERWGFDTQKPEGLIRRILEASSNVDSLVLDYFAGSGTTLAVAHKLNFKWIGVVTSHINPP